METLDISFDDLKVDVPLVPGTVPPPAAAPIPVAPKAAEGMFESFEAGLESSVSGLLSRGKLPDIELRDDHAPWYNKLANSAGQLTGDLPAMFAGGIAGGIAGSEVPVVGNVVGAGAGAFAVPTAIRESLISAYQDGSIKNTGDFLSRVSIIAPKVVKDALVGGLTAGTGKYVGAGAEAIGFGGRAATATAVGAEITTMTSASALLEGKLPEWSDFVNGALLVGGMRGVHAGVNATARRFSNVYAKTGAGPAEIVRDAQLDPQIMDDLGVPPRATPEITDWKTRSAQPIDATGVTNSSELVGRLKTSLGEEHFASKILDKLEPRLKGYQIEVLSEQEWSDRKLSDRRQAQANPNTGVLQFREGVKTEAAFHEVIHEATQTELKSNPSFTNDIVSIMSHTQRAIDAKDVENVSSGELSRFKKAMQNPAEFVAYGLSSPSVINVLRGTRGMGRSPTMFTTFMDTVSRAFGFGAKDYTALHDLVRAVEKGVDAAEPAKKAEAASVKATPENLTASVEAVAEAPTGTPEKVAVETAKTGEAAPAALPEIPRAYERQALDNNTIEAMAASEKAKLMDANNPFTPYDKIEGLSEKSRGFNFSRINADNEVLDVLAKTTQVYQDELVNQTRGKVSWEQTELEAGQKLKDILGSNTDLGLPPGTAENAAGLLARLDLMLGAARHNRALADEMAKTESPTAAQTMEFLASFERLAMIQDVFMGARAEAGRALNILKKTRSIDDQMRAMEALREKYGNDPKALAEAILGLDTIEAAAKVAREGTKATKYEKFVEVMRASMVSGPISQIANITGNLVFTPTAAAVDIAASAIGAAKGSADRVRAVEPLARVAGNIMGVRDGMKLAAIVLKDGGMPGAKSETVKNAVGGMLGEFIRLPFRGLAAGDALARTIFERGETYSLAARQAAKEGLNPATREFRERMAEIANNPSAEMMAEVFARSARYTLNSEMGEIGRATSTFVRKVKMEWAVPFVKTPLNSTEEMLRLTPAGVLTPGWQEAVKKGGVAADRAYAELVMGGAFGAMAFSLASSGILTGAGDPDPRKRATDLAKGWQPYSIKWGDKYYSYQRLAPVGQLIGLYADMQQVWEHSSEEERDKLPKMAAVAMANAVTNQTFLAGFAQIVNAISQPDTNMPKFLRNLAASMTVPGIVSQANQMSDPWQREVNSIMDAIKARVPGLSEQLPPKRDWAGQEIPSRERPFGLVPMTVTTESRDKVMLEASRLNLGFSKAPDSIQLPAKGDKKLGRIDLTPEQKDHFAKTAGEMAHRMLEPIVTSPGWDTMPDMLQKAYYTKIMELSRDAAAKDPTLVPMEARAAKGSQIVNELNKRMQPKP